MATARSGMVGWARTTMATTTTKTTTNSVDDDCRAMRREDIDCGGRIAAGGRGDIDGRARGTGVRRDNIDNRAAVRGDDGIDDALDDLRLRDDDDDDENAFAIAITTTDNDVRRWRRRERWPLRARRNAIVIVADIDINIGISSTTTKRRLIVLAGAAFIGGGEAGTDRRCRPPGLPPLPASFVARAPIPVVARSEDGQWYDNDDGDVVVRSRCECRRR